MLKEFIVMFSYLSLPEIFCTRLILCYQFPRKSGFEGGYAHEHPCARAAKGAVYTKLGGLSRIAAGFRSTDSQKSLLVYFPFCK